MRVIQIITARWIPALLCLWLALPAGNAAAREVTVGLYENSPKIFTTPGGKPAGLFVELIEAVANAEGWQLRFVPCEWADCLQRLESGQLDLMPDVAFSAERQQRFDFHRTSVASSWSQVYTQVDQPINTLQDLAGRRVAVLQGGIQQKFLAQLLATSQIDYVPVAVESLDEGYLAVIEGRADAVVTNSFFAARNSHKYRLMETPIVFLPSTLYFATAKGKNAELLSRIDHHLNRWRQDADSVYFDALHRAMAAPPEVHMPAWVKWSLLTLIAGLLLLGMISLLLRRQVAQRTRDLEHERANLARQVEERTAQLLAAKLEAERLTQVKSDFLANMSHEIRTPMNAILGMLYLAMKGELSPGLRNQLAKAQGAAHSLLGIINDILDFSKIEAGKLELEAVEFGLDTVLEQLTDAIGYQAEHKGIELLIRYDQTIPPRLIGDPLRLGQILLNLAGNAVKFTEQGEIEISLHRLDKPNNENKANNIQLQICIRDSGIGMTPDVQQRLFEKFTQADQSTTRRFGGTGLGLAISKNLVALMGGRIWVEDSEPGRGTTICLTLQLAIAEASLAHQNHLLERVGPLLAGIRVLVVDDNQVSREILAEMLRFFRLEVGVAGNGQGALDELHRAAANESPYDLVLMDWRMPGMNGDEVTQRIHSDKTLCRQPKVIMVTAYGREDVLRLAEQAGAAAFLIKPVSPSNLLDTLLSVLGRGRVLGNEGGLGHAPQFVVSGRLAGARLLLVEDNDINREFARELLRGEGMLVDEAENGAVAVAKVQENTYDAVLMDIQMPVMDGLEAARQMRALGSTPGHAALASLPILAMTALAMAQDAEKSLAAGMNDHVSKPIDPDRLMAALARWVKLAPPRMQPGTAAAANFTAAAGDAATLPDDLESLRCFNAAEGVHRIGGKVDAYRRQLKRFRENYPDALTRLSALIAAAGQADAEASALQRAKDECHALKGVTGNLGAHALFVAVTAIDQQLKRGEIPAAAALSEAGQLLQSAMQEIDRIAVPPAPTFTPPAAPLSHEALRTLIARLSYALEYDLGAAEPLLNELRGALAGTAFADDASAVAARLDIFDIDAAEKQLRTLGEKISANPGTPPDSENPPP